MILHVTSENRNSRWSEKSFAVPFLKIPQNCPPSAPCESPCTFAFMASGKTLNACRTRNRRNFSRTPPHRRVHLHNPRLVPVIFRQTKVRKRHASAPLAIIQAIKTLRHSYRWKNQSTETSTRVDSGNRKRAPRYLVAGTETAVRTFTRAFEKRILERIAFASCIREHFRDNMIKSLRYGIVKRQIKVYWLAQMELPQLNLRRCRKNARLASASVSGKCRNVGNSSALLV